MNNKMTKKVYLSTIESKTQNKAEKTSRAKTESEKQNL